MPLAFVGVVVLAAFAGPAHAQVFTQDSVVGHGTGGLSYHSFDVTATSGPSGENPTGEVSLSLFDGRIFASGPVTCLAVTGQRAVIGFSDEGGQQAGQVIVEVEDLGGPGSGLDTINSSAGTGRDPGDCSPLTSGLLAQVDSGDIVVTDAQPFPTSKDQCKRGGWRQFGFKNQGQCIVFVIKTRVCTFLERFGQKPKFCPARPPGH